MPGWGGAGGVSKDHRPILISYRLKHLGCDFLDKALLTFVASCCHLGPDRGRALCRLWSLDHPPPPPLTWVLLGSFTCAFWGLDRPNMSISPSPLKSLHCHPLILTVTPWGEWQLSHLIGDETDAQRSPRGGQSARKQQVLGFVP